MRRTLLACRNGLTVAAALVLLTACGGSEEEGTATPSPTTETTTSASPTEEEAPQADSEFCTEAAAIQERLDSAFTDTSDPATIPSLLEQAASEIRAIEPPDEIASDWTALADGADQLAAAFAQVDFNDPASLETFEQQVAGLEQELSAASDNVETYLRDQCGIDPDGTESASPTS